MSKLGSGLKNAGSTLGAGCIVAVWLFLIPWIISAALVWLFPGFSYGLVERWVCPANSSVHVQGTEGWFLAVLQDDESVDFPQFTCVDPQGTVVLRGDSNKNLTAYSRVAGIFTLGFLFLGIPAVILLSKPSKRHLQG